MRIELNELQRRECAISGTADLEHLFTFDDFPIFMGCTSEKKRLDKSAPMSWWISKSSGLIQLHDLLPISVIYSESHGSGEVGALWRRHHEAFAEFIQSVNPGSVFEIGGGHGVLAREYRGYREIPWTILEPNPHPVEGNQAKFIRGFFDCTFRFEAAFDTVVHSHVFEHIYHPRQFMDALKDFIAPGKTMLFSIPNMESMLRRGYSNCLNFEHTLLLTEPYVEHLLADYGFSIAKKQYFESDHSIFYHAVRSENVNPVSLPSGLYDRNIKLFHRYVEEQRKLVTELNEKIQAADGPVFIFGAHIFAQVLIGFGLKTKKIEGILDNDFQKQGRRLYGTNLKVLSPAVLEQFSKVHVVLKAGVYSNEIETQLSDINPKVTFLR